MLTRPLTHSAEFARSAAAPWLLTAALVVAVIGAAGDAEAKHARRAPAGLYDGIWNVEFATEAGNCSSGYRVPFTVRGRLVSSAGGGKVTGGIGRGGAVSVRVSVGASVASGNGRLAGNVGAGRWSGLISGDRCSGAWQATRG
ncbi:hypothetical protein HNR60_003206 [Rhodopseudomonas rhenobacensis]|uniref:Uncharacterized protein n=1 Tax=Rhodopseudomonas rhenobacensis TaxID=87461 RepID=A0A7W8E003_9BRAD|nr:hypothetical protein [Rhodopseudomonas rhenobacensis]MBB5048440.1 hypothetical protein [Rhodopseudomonas rhenobacensis]